MKPRDRHPARDTGQPRDTQEPRTSGNSGRGAASALEHLIHQEKARRLHNPSEPRERLPAQA